MINPREVPVFVITGFLESGKTTFITNAILSDPKLQSERVLIVACEEGETEYALYKNAYIHYIEEKEEMQEFIFLELCEKYNPTYVIIEYNAIWGMQVLYNAVMPDSWRFAQQATIIDGQTFEAYSSNMKNIFADMVRGSSMVVVNRCTREDDFKLYKDSIKRSAPRAEIVYMSDEEGILDILLEDDIPYDLSGDVITVNKENYLTWYVDTIDNPERYLGKTVDYIGIALKPAQFRDGYFTVGNEVMTC